MRWKFLQYFSIPSISKLSAALSSNFKSYNTKRYFHLFTNAVTKFLQQSYSDLVLENVEIKMAFAFPEKSKTVEDLAAVLAQRMLGSIELPTVAPSTNH